MKLSVSMCIKGWQHVHLWYNIIKGCDVYVTNCYFLVDFIVWNVTKISKCYIMYYLITFLVAFT
jgi:hypothetical protein